MAQVFVNLPAPSSNGAGAPVDVSSFGPIKTMTLAGGADCVVTIEMSNDPGAINWAPVWVFNQSGTKTLEVAAHFMRAVVQQYKSGTPVVDVGGTNEGASFVQLVAPAGDGVGAPVDVSALGIFRTVHVGAPFRGQCNIEVSEDGTNWATAFSFQHADQTSLVIAAQFMRVRRNGVPALNPGLPIVYVGCTDQISGDRGVAISAGTQSVGTGTVAFANSNGITFGMSGSSQVTASFDGIRSVSAGTAVALGPGISFLNGNGITFGVTGSTITGSVQTAGGTASGVGISAGTQVATTGAVQFLDSNGISFGMSNSSQVTATFAAIKQLSAGTVAFTNGSLSIANSNNVSFGIAGSTLTASVFQPAVNRVVGFTATGGEGDTTVTFAPALGSTNYSVFGQLNGVSEIFGLDIPSGTANRSVSAFKISPTATMASGDAIAFFLFQST